MTEGYREHEAELEQQGTSMSYGCLGETIVIHKDKWGMPLYELVDEVIIPLLLAAGYHPDTISEVFDTE